MDRLSPLSYDSGCDSLSIPSPKLQKEASRSTCSPAKAVASDEAALPETAAQSTYGDRKRKGQDGAENDRKRFAAGESEDYPMTNCGQIVVVPADKDDNKILSADSATSIDLSIKKEDFEFPAPPSCSISSSSDSGIPSPGWSNEPCTSCHESSMEPEEKCKKSKSPIIRKKRDDFGNWIVTEEMPEDFSCQWTKCTVEMKNADSLYDHIISKHVEEIRDAEPGVVPDVVACNYGKCKMSISRGDREKKFKWLLEHIRTRHSGNARAFKCLMEGCTERFSCISKVESHVRNQHIASPRKVKEAPAPQKLETWYGVKKLHAHRPRPSGMRSTLTRHFDRVIQEYLRLFKRLNYRFKIVPNRRPGYGAAHRKHYGPTTYTIIPLDDEQPSTSAASNTNNDDGSFIPLRELMEGDENEDASSDSACSSDSDLSDVESVYEYRIPRRRREDDEASSGHEDDGEEDVDAEGAEEAAEAQVEAVAEEDEDEDQMPDLTADRMDVDGLEGEDGEDDPTAEPHVLEREDSIKPETSSPAAPVQDERFFTYKNGKKVLTKYAFSVIFPYDPTTSMKNVTIDPEPEEPVVDTKNITMDDLFPGWDFEKKKAKILEYQKEEEKRFWKQYVENHSNFYNYYTEEEKQTHENWLNSYNPVDMYEPSEKCDCCDHSAVRKFEDLPCLCDDDDCQPSTSTQNLEFCDTCHG